MIVFVDGENFRQNLAGELLKKRLIKHSDTEFNYDVLGLIREALLDDTPEIWYYASEVKWPRGHEITSEVDAQMRRIEEKANHWVPMLEEQGIKYIKAGNLKPKMAKPCRNCGEREEIIQEKGVDVRMALDIFEQSLKDNCHEIAVLSSDVDICPAIMKARERKTRVRYICFSDRVNLALNRLCYKTMTIGPKMIKKHFEGVVEGGEVDEKPKFATEEYIDEN